MLSRQKSDALLEGWNPLSTPCQEKSSGPCCGASSLVVSTMAAFAGLFHSSLPKSLDLRECSLLLAPNCLSYFLLSESNCYGQTFAQINKHVAVWKTLEIVLSEDCFMVNSI